MNRRIRQCTIFWNQTRTGLRRKRPQSTSKETSYVRSAVAACSLRPKWCRVQSSPRSLNSNQARQQSGTWFVQAAARRASLTDRTVQLTSFDLHPFTEQSGRCSKLPGVHLKTEQREENVAMPELTDAEILLRLTNIEDSTVERKTAADFRDCLKTAVAFSNSLPIGDQGIIFVGVFDDGRVEDRNNLESLQIKVSPDSYVVSGTTPPVFASGLQCPSGDSRCDLSDKRLHFLHAHQFIQRHFVYPGCLWRLLYSS